MVPGQQRGRLVDHLAQPPAFERARPRHVRARPAGCRAQPLRSRRDRPPPGRRTARTSTVPSAGRAARRRSARCPARSRQPWPERGLRRSRLARGGFRFVVGQADREQDMPSAPGRERGELAKLARFKDARRPGRARCRLVGPGHTRVGGHPSEAKHPGAERTQQRDQIAGFGVSRYLGEARQLEGQPEKFRRHRPPGVRLVDRDRHRGRGALRRPADRDGSKGEHEPPHRARRTRRFSGGFARLPLMRPGASSTAQ